MYRRKVFHFSKWYRPAKYYPLTGQEILPSEQSRLTEQAKFTCSPLGKAFEKQTKTIQDQGNKQADALKVLKPEESQQ